SLSEERLKAEDAIRLTGSMAQQFRVEYFRAIQEGHTEKGLEFVRRILMEGKDASRFIEDVILFSRDLLVVKQASNPPDLLKIAEPDESFQALCEAFDTEILYEAIKICNDTQKYLRLSNNAKVYLEVYNVLM